MAVDSKLRSTQLVVAGLAASVLVIIFVVFGIFRDQPSNPVTTIDTVTPSVDLSLSDIMTETATAENSWLSNARDRINELSSSVDNISDGQSEILKQLEKLRQTGQRERLSDLEEKQKQIMQTLEKMLETQATLVQAQEPSAGTQKTQQPSAKSTQSTSALNPFGDEVSIDVHSGPSPLSRGAMVLSAELKSENLPQASGKKNELKELGSFLPTGSFASGTIIQGVNAVANARSQSEPVPIIIQLNSGFSVPSFDFSTQRSVNLGGCRVMGSARAELSSESVLVRLETLSCTTHDDRIFETSISGLIAGRGVNGVRGTVVSKDSDLVKTAFLAGALEGFAGAVTGAASPSLNFTGDQQSALSQLGIGPAASGAAGAASKFADYYIERAEQFQPTIVVSAGTEVEIVLTKGVDLW